MPQRKYDLPRYLSNNPTGSELWYLTFYNPNKQPTRKTVRLKARNLAGALRERERLLDAFELSPSDSNRFDPWAPKEAAPSAPAPLLLSAAIARFMLAHRGLAKSTRESRESGFKTFTARIDPSGHKRLDAITAPDIRRFIERPGQAIASQNKRLTEMISFFGWAIDEGLVESSPATAYKKNRSRGMSVHDRQRQKGEPRSALMPDDHRQIRSALQLSSHRYLVDVMDFALATGLRRRELCYLRRLDVHLDKPLAGQSYPVTGYIVVRSWRNPANGEEFRTKTAKKRVVPLTPLAARIASQSLAAHTTDDGFEPLLRAPRGGRLGDRKLSELFAKYRRQVGLSDAYTFHSTRHATASWLMMLGVNLFSIKRLLGHASLDQLDTYAETCEEFLLGDARGLQREMLSTLCPGLPPSIIDRVLPERQSMVAALADERFGAVQSLRSIVPPEEVLFGGIGYAAAARQSARTPADRSSFAGSFQNPLN